MTIRIIVLPPRLSRLLIYVLCLLVSLPAVGAFGQNRRVTPGSTSASVGVSGEDNSDSGSLLQEAVAAQKSSLPIVFVPGTAGSELRLSSEKEKCAGKKYDKDLYWLGLSTLKKNCIKVGRLDKEGNDIEGNEVYAPHPLTAFSVSFSKRLKRLARHNLGYEPLAYEEEVYANFLSWAYHTFGENRFFVAPYDWRKGATDESFNSIDKIVDRARTATGQEKVILLAHSLGGLVSRDYIVRSGGNKVAALIAVGTPWLGTPKAARALLWGYNFDIGLVEESKGKKKIKGLPKDFETEVCKNSRCESLSRTSFLKREDVRELAENFPGLYMQLPTEEFMKRYGSYYDQGFRSVIWGKDAWKDLEDFYRSKNSKLYDRVKAWRVNNLKDEKDENSKAKDYGVRHYLIGGVYNPACKDKSTDELKKTCAIGNRMDMQMSQEEHAPPTSIFRKIVVSIADVFASFLKAEAYDDPFVALDSAYEWGDGTTPLLSATAGVYIRGGEYPCLRGADGKTQEIKPCFSKSAKEYLGELTQAEAVVLGARYGHSAMLNDPKIKDRILEIYREVSGNTEPSINAPGADIHSISVTIKSLFTDKNNVIVAEFEGVKLLMPKTSVILRGTSTAPILFDNPMILDSAVPAPVDRDKNGLMEQPRGAYRNLRMSDLKKMSISLARRNDSSKDVVITGVEFVINEGKPHAAGESNFPLTVPKEGKKEGQKILIPLPSITAP